MADQGAEEEPTPRNTVTLSLDGDEERVLDNYRRSLGHFRCWNRSKGIRVDVSGVYGEQREVYTTPPDGTFYLLVRYGGRKLTFVIQGRGGWLVGYFGMNGTYQLKLTDQTVPYMNTNGCEILSFTGNHRYISDGVPGCTLIGLHSLRNAFNTLWEYTGANPEPDNFRRAIGVFVIHLCEAAKMQPIFGRICLSFLDPSISRLDSGSETTLDECCKNWSLLSREGMANIHYHLAIAPNDDDAAVPIIDNHGVVIITTAEDVHRVVRILHRDGFHQGVFIHEPIPPPPRFWEPIDPGNGDSDSDGSNPENDNNDDEDDADQRKGGRRGRQKKHDKRNRRPQQVHKFTSKKKRSTGGEPINFPDRLLDRWHINPGGNFADKENVIPINISGTQLRAPYTSSWKFEQDESSRTSPHKNLEIDRLTEGEKTWLLVTDVHTLLGDESRKSVMQLKGKTGTKLIVPLIVIRELECLKQQEGLSGTELKALCVLKWIHECIEHENWWIHVQSSSEEECQAGGITGCLHSLQNLSSTTSGANVISPTTEDYVLQCACLFRKATSNETVVILSDSASLNSRAKGEGVLCERAKDFCGTLICPFSNRLFRSNNLVPVHEESSKGLRVLLDSSVHGNKQS